MLVFDPSVCGSIIFEKIIKQETVKDVWDTLDKLYDGDVKLKKVNMQSLRKHYENLQMNDGEAIANLFSKLVVLTNQMRLCEEKIYELWKVEIL